MKQVLRCAVVWLLALGLSGCMFPEKYQAELQVNKDGTYNFKYEGTLVSLLSRSEEIKTGKLTESASNSLKLLEDTFKKDTHYKNVKYLGNSTYQFRYEAKGLLRDGQSFKFPGETALLTLTRQGKKIEISSPQLTEKNMEELRALNLHPNGKLVLKTNAVIESHNAPTEAPGGQMWLLRSLATPGPKAMLRID